MIEGVVNSFNLLIMVNGKSRIEKINFRFFPSFDFQLDLCTHRRVRRGDATLARSPRLSYRWMLRKLLTVIETGVPLLTTATLGRFKSSSVALSERLSIRFAKGLKKPSSTADQIWGSRLSTVVVLLPNRPLILLELLTLGSVNT